MGGWKSAATAMLLGAGLLCTLVAQSASASSSYVALGDSYAAGDGTRVYYHDGTGCDRSPDSYPPLVAAAENLSLTFAACSGATSTEMVANQLGALGSDTNVVTVQVGGDDAGFTNVVEACAVFYFPCQRAIDTADTFIQSALAGLLDTAYNEIVSAAPNAKVLVVGYPLGFDAAGSRCGLNLLSSAHELEVNQTIALLDGVIQSRAQAHGFAFIDARSTFSAHELCSSSPWLNNVTLPVIASFHPNIAGELAYAQLVESALP